MIEHLKSDLTTHFVYSAEFAQRKANYEKTAKGAPLKLGSDITLVKAIVALIKNGFSPDAVIMHFNREGWSTDIKISTKTLYSYIYSGLIEDISIKNLLYQGKRYKPRSKPPKHSRAGTAQRSISKRPELANSRLEYGHWEIDTVRSAKNTSLECLLTLTERMTRFEIIIKLKDGKSATVIEALNKLEQELTPEIFKKLFKSITADNGSEFMDFDGLELSEDKTYKRLDLYFAHPYRACERGTNENHNGIIRRFFKKGTDF